MDRISFHRKSSLFCFSHLRWRFVYQRPQHLITRASIDYDVTFFEEPVVEHDRRQPSARIESCDAITVVTPLIGPGTTADEAIAHQRSLVSRLAQHLPEGPLLWYYTPMARLVSNHLKPQAIVYDCMDELSSFRGAPPALLKLESELFDVADVVFTGGASLHAAKSRRHPNVACFPSSIDAKHFAAARRQDRQDPPDQAPIGGPRIGFFGVIDERMDLALVEAAARLRPDWQWVMIGPVVKIDPAELPQAPNLHWLGQKDYRELPAYLGGWQAGWMPFAINESTRFISPTKTPEFLAAGLPVVSTPITDVVRPYGERGLVAIAADAAAAVAALDEAMAEDPRRRRAKVSAFLRGISWDQTYAGMKARIDACLKPERRLLGAPSFREGRVHV